MPRDVLLELANGRAGEEEPAYSSGGARIAYERFNGSSESDIWAMNTDGTGQIDLSNAAGAQDTSPAYSPDDKLIAFKRQSGTDLDIWAMNADGSGQVDLTKTPAPTNEFQPDWEYVYKCAGRRATIIGTDSAEKLKGTKGPDVIVGNGGNDKIKGKGGNDRICGGAGKDKLVAAKGSKDRCVGGPGKDTGKGCEKGKL